MAPGFSPEVPVALELPADLAQAQGYSASSRRQGAERSCANRSRRVRVVNRHVSPPWAVKLWVLLPPSGRHLFKNGLCSLWANRPKRTLGARKSGLLRSKPERDSNRHQNCTVCHEHSVCTGSVFNCSVSQGYMDATLDAHAYVKLTETSSMKTLPARGSYGQGSFRAGHPQGKPWVKPIAGFLETKTGPSRRSTRETRLGRRRGGPRGIQVPMWTTPAVP
jgi:hypothetical protein